MNLIVFCPLTQVCEIILENKPTETTSLKCKCNMQLCEIPCVTGAPPAHKTLANTLQRGNSVHRNISYLNRLSGAGNTCMLSRDCTYMLHECKSVVQPFLD